VGDLAGEITDSARSCGLPAERVAQFPAAAYEAALNFLKARLPENVLVLVKGSRSLALEKIVTPLVTGYETQK